jgi:hypothetical protein
VVAGGGRNEKGEGEKRIRLCKQGHRGMGYVLGATSPAPSPRAWRAEPQSPPPAGEP